MFTTEFLEYELALSEADNYFESAYDQFYIDAYEVYTMECASVVDSEDKANEIFTDMCESVIEAIAKFFAKLVTAIRGLYVKVKSKIQAKKRTKEMEKALQMLVEKAEKYKNDPEFKKTKIEIYPAINVYKIYHDFITTEIKLIEKLYSKEYNSVDEYVKACEVCNAELNEKANSLNLTLKDVQVIKCSVMQGLSFTQKELDNIEHIYELITKDYIGFIQNLEKLAVKEDDPTKVKDMKVMTGKCASTLNGGFAKIEELWLRNYKEVAKAVAAIGVGATVGVAIAKAASNSNK